MAVKQASVVLPPGRKRRPELAILRIAGAVRFSCRKRALDDMVLLAVSYFYLLFSESNANASNLFIMIECKLQICHVQEQGLGTMEG
jgi:hypothetical protein